jgi:hypothetical protein
MLDDHERLVKQRNINNNNNNNNNMLKIADCVRAKAIFPGVLKAMKLNLGLEYGQTFMSFPPRRGLYRFEAERFMKMTTEDLDIFLDYFGILDDSRPQMNKKQLTDAIFNRLENMKLMASGRASELYVNTPPLVNASDIADEPVTEEQKRREVVYDHYVERYGEKEGTKMTVKAYGGTVSDSEAESELRDDGNIDSAMGSMDVGAAAL